MQKKLKFILGCKINFSERNQNKKYWNAWYDKKIQNNMKKVKQ